MNTISKLNHMNLELNKIENRLNNLQNKIIKEELNKENTTIIILTLDALLA